MDSFARSIWEQLQKSIGEEKRCSARLLYHKEEGKYYLRAVTSEQGYKNYGIKSFEDFSTFGYYFPEIYNHPELYFKLVSSTENIPDF